MSNELDALASQLPNPDALAQVAEQQQQQQQQEAASSGVGDVVGVVGDVAEAVADGTVEAVVETTGDVASGALEVVGSLFSIFD